MTGLLAGDRVELPTFNFVSGKSEYGKNNFMQIGAEDVLVIEGIHCLNDALTSSIPKNDKYRVYISALTQLNLDEHNRIATNRRSIDPTYCQGCGPQRNTGCPHDCHVELGAAGRGI